MKANGDICPCLVHWDTILGNIRETPIEKLWHSQRAQEIRRQVKVCGGCLNTWGLGWSMADAYFPFLWFIARHLSFVLKELKGG